MIVALRLLGTLVLAVLGWAVLGYLASAPLGAIYGWSGHPAIPAAPSWVYILVYAVVLPLLCLAGGWKMTRWTENRWGKGRGDG